MTDLAVSHIHPAVVCLFVCLVGWLASRLVVGCCFFFAFACQGFWFEKEHATPVPKMFRWQRPSAPADLKGAVKIHPLEQSEQLELL